ncbi:hypothetical protein OF83DRAFT_1125352 [Amylostereum chailletii]|nr:hypothetical protein OF83DRAFT_1125352 [Amylostereum chailletii]
MTKFSGNTSSAVMNTRSKTNAHAYHTRSKGIVAAPLPGRGGHRNAEAGPSKPQTKRARYDTHTLKKKQDNARAAAQVAQKKEQIENAFKQAAYVYVGNLSPMVNMGELSLLFRDFGRVLRIQLRCATGSADLSNGSRGVYYAIVLFRSITAATDALSLNGAIVSVQDGGYCRIKVVSSPADLPEMAIVNSLPVRSLREAKPLAHQDTLVLAGAEFDEVSASPVAASDVPTRNAQAGPSRQRTVQPWAQPMARNSPVTDSTLIPVARHNKVGLFGVSWKYTAA